MNRPIPIVPLLVVIAFWERDQGDAIELCRLLCGLQEKHAGQEVHIMLVNRQDCKMDPNLVKIAAQKFNVLTHRSTSAQRGWPMGCNGMFASSMMHIGMRLKNRYETVYWMEPDAIPIHPNWHRALVHAWRKRHPSALVVGCRADCNGDGSGDHISGSCLYHPEITKKIPQIVATKGAAWDYEHRAVIVRNGQHTNLIANHYKARNILPATIEDLLKQGVVILHGTKDRSVINYVRTKYGIS